MTRPRRFFAYFFLAATTFALPAIAQPRGNGGLDPSSTTPTTDDQRKAQEHFAKAKDLYLQGSYTAALNELTIARGLDPKAKDLVMNLGIVSEKLGKYDDALNWLKQFLDMDGVTAAERAKAEANMKRIEGAKKEAAARNPPPSASSATKPPAPPPPTREPADTSKGRVDTATIIAGTIAGVGVVAGATFGILALSKEPNGFVTGRDGTYADLQSQTSSAHTFAIVADVSLGVGVVAAVAALYLYFGRDTSAKKTGLGPQLGFGGLAF